MKGFLRAYFERVQQYFPLYLNVFNKRRPPCPLRKEFN